jgi:cytochrome c
MAGRSSSPAGSAIREDGTTANGGITGSAVIVQPLMGHDEHGHPLLEYPGLSGVIPVPASHGDVNDNLFLVLEARYADDGGAGARRR